MAVSPESNDRIGAVVDRIGHVRYFRSGGARVSDHGIQHLWAVITRLIVIITFFDDLFLQVGNASSAGISRPVPRATIMPSLQYIISSKF